MPAYRYHRRKRCYATFPGGQLKPLRYEEGHYHKRGGSLQKCPNCDVVGFIQDFPVVKGAR